MGAGSFAVQKICDKNKRLPFQRAMGVSPYFLTEHHLSDAPVAHGLQEVRPGVSIIFVNRLPGGRDYMLYGGVDQLLEKSRTPAFALLLIEIDGKICMGKLLVLLIDFFLLRFQCYLRHLYFCTPIW